VGGQPVVVDSGVSEYTAGRWRDYFRSTRAHNTIEIEVRNQSDVWSSFRVAERARPEGARWQLGRERIVVQAGHDGYWRPPGRVIHRRAIFWQKGHFWLVWDTLSGPGRPIAASHVHLHPAIQIQQQDEALWRLDGAAEPLWLNAFGHRRHSICTGQSEPFCQGWYSESFGEKRPNTVLTLHFGNKASAHCGYVISKAVPVEVDFKADAGNAPQIKLLQAKNEFTYGLGEQADAIE
jgi:hypothetical protein